jgi:Na+-driven multidrug efflux pump
VVAAIANNVVAGFGSMPLAAFGVMFKLFAFAFMPCLGVNQGVLPLTGYNYGARKLARVREVVIKGALAATTVTALFSVLFLLFPRFLVSLFNQDPAFVDLAAGGLRISSIAFAGVGAAVVFTAFFQGIGKAVPAMFLSLARQLIFYLPAMLVLSRVYGLTGFWTAIPVSDGLAIAAAVVWTAVTFRRLGVPLLGTRAAQ